MLTADLDDTTTDEDDVPAEEVVETPTTSTKDKGAKKGKSPRRIWGKKFKVSKLENLVPMIIKACRHTFEFQEICLQYRTISKFT